MKRIAAMLAGWIVGCCIMLCVGCSMPFGRSAERYVIKPGTPQAATMKTLAAKADASTVAGLVIVDLSCDPGVKTIMGWHRAGHDVTITGKGGPFQVTKDGFFTTDVDNCLSDPHLYGYILVEFSTPVTDVIFDTEYDPEAIMYCWLSGGYGRPGSTRGRFDTGPAAMHYDPYQGHLPFGLGYGPPGFDTCWVYDGGAEWRLGYMP